MDPGWHGSAVPEPDRGSNQPHDSSTFRVFKFCVFHPFTPLPTTTPSLDKIGASDELSMHLFRKPAQLRLPFLSVIKLDFPRQLLLKLLLLISTLHLHYLSGH